ncbi:DEAD/DEAH box helicase [Cytobacillus spongiae]|nr:DEAD/DEAH box helicase [Cytobacillus spongiae]UII54222.1 DEAD/DEAH box helicase [Cytobacillus spongiae]
MPNFTALGVSNHMVEKLRENGISVATPIQEQAIPKIVEGKDLIGQAQTGTGKTLAFVLPILAKLNPNEEHIQALIVTPTRELAIQITAEINTLLSADRGIDVLAVYGGQDVEKQLKGLKKKKQIVVGTPGRLLDHLRRKTINLSKLSHLVLDEADQMLHIGFLSEVEDIIHKTPKSRQTLLFSATMPAEIRQLATKHMKHPEYLQVEKVQGPADTVQQMAIHTTDRGKQGTLVQLVEMHRPFLSVIFCRTKRRVTKLHGVLKNHGFTCDELHGDLSQAKREQVMKRFRDADIQLLIATDVAARGLDVEGVTHVYNYDIPLDGESYIHRIGRTGRAGTKGMAITLYTSEDRATLDLIEKEINIRIDKKNIGNMNTSEGQKSAPVASTEKNKKPRKKPVAGEKKKKAPRREEGRGQVKKEKSFTKDKGSTSKPSQKKRTSSSRSVPKSASGARGKRK